MNCSNCSNEAMDGDNYCRQCGEPLSSEDALTCECGAEVMAEDNYCHACGAAFSSEESEQQGSPE